MKFKLCRNCVYFRIDYDCHKRRFVVSDYVTGGSVTSYSKCWRKNHDGMCEDYERRSTWLQRMRKWLRVY